MQKIKAKWIEGCRLCRAWKQTQIPALQRSPLEILAEKSYFHNKTVKQTSSKCTGPTTVAYATRTYTLGKAQITRLLGQRANKQEHEHFWAEMDSGLKGCGLPWQSQASSRQEVFKEHTMCQAKYEPLIPPSLRSFTLVF